MEVSSSAMRGYGYSMPPAMATLICVCSVRLIWVWTVFAASPDYVTLIIEMCIRDRFSSDGGIATVKDGKVVWRGLQS